MKNDVKQTLIREIVSELKSLKQDPDYEEEEIVALLQGECEMSFEEWVLTCSEWYATIQELAGVQTIKDIDEDLGEVLGDIKHEVRLEM